MGTGKPYIIGKAAELAYDSTTDSIKVQPVYGVSGPTIDITLLDEVVATGASVETPTVDVKELTVCIVAASVTDGAIFTMEGSPDNITWGAVGSIGIAGIVTATQTINVSGTTFYEIVNASSLKYFRINLSTWTDGTYSAYLTARS